MRLYHLTPRGDVKECRAKKGKCPYDSGSELDPNHTTALNKKAAARQLEIAQIQAIPARAVNFNVSAVVDPTTIFLSAEDLRNRPLNPKQMKRLIEEAEANGELQEIRFSALVQPFDGVEKFYLTRSFYAPPVIGAGPVEFNPGWALKRYPYGTQREPYTVLLDPNEQFELLSNPNLKKITTSLAFDKNQEEVSDIASLNHGMSFSPREDILLPSELSEYLASERRAEIEHYVREVMMTVEGTAYLTDHPRSKRLKYKTGFYTHPGLPVNENMEITGSVNYATSGWRPEFLRNAKVGDNTLKVREKHIKEITELTRSGKKDQIKHVMLRAENNIGRELDLKEYNPVKGISDSIRFFEKSSAAGAAKWDMKRKNGLWEIAITGTRGSKTRIRTDSPEEAVRQAEEFMRKNMKPINYAHEARKLGIRKKSAEAYFMGDTDKEDVIDNRTKFFSKVVDETKRLEARIAKNQQRLKEIREQEAQVYAEAARKAK